MLRFPRSHKKQSARKGALRNSVRRALVALTLCIGGAQTISAEPIGVMERYALAADRQAMLAELIPGSEDFYFYHCLHYQTTGELERSEAILRDWLAEHKGRETPLITAMIDRQRLLTYNISPQRTVDHLIRRLGIKLDHAPPVTKGERRYPSELNVAALDIDRLVKDALRRNDPLKPVGMAHLAELYRTGKTAGVSISLKEFLKRVNGPYIANLDELVIKELSSRRPNEQKFGDVAAHNHLTLDELRSVAKSVSAVSDDNGYVAAVLRRLRPDGDSDPSQQPEVQLAYLQQVEDYVSTLPQSYNSLKAASIYRLLEANVTRGNYDRALFLRYLQLPRTSPIVPAEWARRPSVKAKLGDNFMSMALLPPIGDEQPLVRAHLEHFLKEAKNTDAFSSYFKPEYLRQVFAETKLLEGIGDEERWYKMLSASQRQALRDSTQLRLSVENPRTFAADQPTKLRVDVKNVDELVVRIYEINTESYYRTHSRPIDTDIDLDGLVATHEKRLPFNHPAVRRHREDVSLDEIKGRGVWIVDLVGKGMRARALVRRGEIDHVDSVAADGMVFTIVDENRKPIPVASMLVGSRKFVADDQGRILLPPVAENVQRRAMISDGKISRPITFRHLRESYRLTAGMHVDRTQLQSGGNVDVLIRPRLVMGNTPIDPQTLTDVAVRVEARDLDNVVTNMNIGDVKLDQDAELVVPMRVPSRLASLKVTLVGVVDGLADGKKRTVETSRSWDVAGIRRTSHTHDAFLTRDGDNFVIEVRGRSGEPVADATVNVSLTTNSRRATVDQTLQADRNGQVKLKDLPGVDQIRFGVTSGLQHARQLKLNQVRWPNEIHTTTERGVRLPLADVIKSAAERYRLVELRAGSNRADQSDRLSVKDGMLVIGNLASGDYHLIDRLTAARTVIAVVDGPEIERIATGRVRHRSMAMNEPVSIASIDRNKEGLRIQLSGDSADARVHIYASRYIDSTSPMDQLYIPEPSLYGRRITLPRNGYVGDLRLGDEYQYVLRRQYATKYPGVMIPRPSLILNPWETEETTNQSQSAAAGDVPPPSAAAPDSMAEAAAKRKSEAQSRMVGSDYDFLGDSGAVAANLRADEKGVVTVPADLIESMPVIQIVVSDSLALLQRTITAPLADAETVDLRLAKALDAKKSYSFERAVSIVSKDNPLDLESLGSAQLQVYASVGSLLKLYKTLVGDSRLSEFDELGYWHKLDRTQKLDAYSRLASHELHLFLWAHDHGFFEDIVGPYLANKKEKQFVDHWLLGDDLSEYTTLWRYNQLNAAERVLLAMKVNDVRDSVARELREHVAEQEEDFATVRMRIDSALKDSGLRFERLEAKLGADASDMVEAEPMMEMRMQLFGAIADSDSRGIDKSRQLRAKEVERESDRYYSKQSRGRRVMSRRGGMLGGGGRSLAFYRELDSTKQWAESHWDRIRTVGGPHPSSLISRNGFWADLVAGEPGKIDVSSNLLSPVENRHSALVALALCGLPLTPGDVGLPTERDEAYAPEHAVAVVTKRLNVLDAAEGESSILIGQRFDDLHRSSSRSDDISEPSEFLTGVAYKGQTVVSNPTAARRTVDVFWQIPAGSLPLATSQTTDSRTMVLEPFAVQSIEYQFYFPAAGSFVHYPATVSSQGKLIARGGEKEFKVVAQPTEHDNITWEKVVRNGSADDIRDFLVDANLRKLNWMLVAHRMQDQEVYRVVIDSLRDANMPVAELWAYSLKHRDDDAMSDYLSIREDLVGRVGPSIDSPLLSVDAIERRTHELLEYAPLVRARIHPLRGENEILNPTFLGQYRSFVRMLGFDNEIPDSERLVLAYYLLLQNRIEEAIDHFGKVDREKIATKLQYDYVDAYLALHQEHYKRAEKIARQHAGHAVPRWAHRFGELSRQLNQRLDLNRTEKLVSVDKKDAGDKPVDVASGDLSVIDRERKQQAASQAQPEVIVRIEGDSLRIDHRKAKEVTVNLYGVDLELLFSKAPFVREDLQRMAMVRPAQSEQVEFESATGVGRYELNENLSRQTLLVEVVAGASRSTALYYGGEITTYVSESYGQLQTTDAQSHQPIPGAYVKVYAKYPNGNVRFFKDGYTDARGRFDYASISANDAKGAERFAILVMSSEQGATLHDVRSPNQ